MHRLKASIGWLVLPLLLAAQAPEQSINVFSDGSRGTIPVSDVSGTPMIPLRGIATFVDAQVRPGSEPGAATISGNGKMARVSDGRNFVPVEGKLVLLQSPAKLVGDEWFVPLDFLTKVLPSLSSEDVAFRQRDRMLVLGSSFPQLRIRSRPSPTFTRVMIESDRDVPMELSEEGDAIRVRIDTPFLNTDFRDEDVGDGVVERITLERQDESYLVTVVLGDRFGTLRLNSARGTGDPVVLDLLRTRTPIRNAPTVEMDLSEQTADEEDPDEDADASESGDATDGDEENEGNPNAEEVFLAEDYELGSGNPAPDMDAGPEGPSELRIITIDPGHGGSETGALGLDGSLEKDVVLGVARRFRAKLQSGLGVRVILTRDGDNELTLDERAAIANTNKSSLFVSIHADASPRRRAQGSSVYFLSYSSSGENTPTTAGGGGDLDFILWDMAQASHLSQSSQLAEILQEELRSITGGERVNRGIKQNTFRVLRGATMPAVLVELGFISNPDEEKLLTSEEYQERLAEALYRGVRRYKDLFESTAASSRGARRSEP